ncbi:right-handed parallel beta-helix repeat-containing protein [Winogradskyella tangerina]|uniref:right-handed parallel beta-helix repeat-containing protein n=1 Tax=Winogradskyella tangerina TaxID=2023240 RepID=UPI00130048A2|nr:right-handed parallel beta-helix repeat-containing protein [Winogradskyella tangerina]
MRIIFCIFSLVLTMTSFAQNEYHVFPIDGKNIKGSKVGDGSLDRPWELQTALSQSSERINGGDIIWIHEGTYNGNYVSTLTSTVNSEFITVSAYKNDKVILNGNIQEKTHYVLEVMGSRVIFKNFEITYLGEFNRTKSGNKFKAVTGVNHIEGEDCKFQNLIIHNIPGSGFGSWKSTGGSIIEDCLIYNNGYQAQRGHGVGIYVQNESNKTRILRNNIVFNNYYKGIEVWSASSGTNREFVKNVDLEDNIVFNNGAPSGQPWSNLIVASGDRKGVNIAKNINVRDNVFYHNVDFQSAKNYGYGNSITVGFTDKALVEDILIENNVIIGRNNALNILHAKSLKFQNNTVYTGYIHFEKSTLTGLENGSMVFNNNRYHTRKVKGLRILKHKDFQLSEWKTKYDLDAESQWKSLQTFEVDPVLKVEKLNTNSLQFNVAVLDKEGDDVEVDFSSKGLKKGLVYKIYDIENRHKVIKTGLLGEDMKITFPMGLSEFEKPLHNSVAVKSQGNFGVYRIEFESAKKTVGFHNRFFGWLF